MGIALASIGVINVLARSDPGSPALRALLAGNIGLHVLAVIVDVAQHLQGFVQTLGLASGAIVHGLLTAGFLFYLSRMERTPRAN
jgi:hypothetical protein